MVRVPRSQAVSRSQAEPGNEELREPSENIAPEAKLVWQEVRQALDEELQHLPERLRSPLLLCYLSGLTRDEAAKQLGWSLGTLKRRLEEGRHALRIRLERRGIVAVGLALGRHHPVHVVVSGVGEEVAGRLVEADPHRRARGVDRGGIRKIRAAADARPGGAGRQRAGADRAGREHVARCRDRRFRHRTLERDDFPLNRRPALAYCWSMISENRYPLFGIML